MTLKDIIARIEGVAAAQPSVNMIVRQDVFRINDAVQKRYGLFAWVQRRHTTSVRSSLMDYSFVFYYVDRLTESRDNMTDIHSAGIQTLDNIIRQVADGEVVSVDDPYSFNVAIQRFVEDCGVVYAEVTFSAKLDGVCAEEFETDDNVIII